MTRRLRGQELAKELESTHAHPLMMYALQISLISTRIGGAGPLVLFPTEHIRYPYIELLVSVMLVKASSLATLRSSTMLPLERLR